ADLSDDDRPGAGGREGIEPRGPERYARRPGSKDPLEPPGPFVRLNVAPNSAPHRSRRFSAHRILSGEMTSPDYPWTPGRNTGRRGRRKSLGDKSLVDYLGEGCPRQRFFVEGSKRDDGDRSPGARGTARPPLELSQRSADEAFGGKDRSGGRSRS